MAEIKAELYHYHLTCLFKIRPADTFWKISRSPLSIQLTLYGMYLIADTFLRGITSGRFNLSLVFILYVLFLLTSFGLQVYLASDMTRISMGIWSMINKPLLLPSTVYYMFVLCYELCKSRAWLPTQMCLLLFDTLRVDIPDIHCRHLWGWQIWCRSCTQMLAGRGVWRPGRILWRVSDETRCPRVSSKNILKATECLDDTHALGWPVLAPVGRRAKPLSFSAWLVLGTPTSTEHADIYV